MLKKVSALLFAALLVASVGATTVTAKTLKVSMTVAAGSLWDQGAQKFKELVEERSKLRVRVYANGTLVNGNDRTELEMLQTGGVDIALKSTIWLTQLDPQMTIVGMPWLFPNAEVALGFMDGKMGQELSKTLESKSMIPLAWGSGSFFQLYSNQGPVNTPADIVGKKIRVPGIDVFVDSWKQIGSVPIAMSFSEVFPALQTGAIDGGTSPIPLIYSSRFYEVSKHISVVNFAFEAIGVLAGENSWKKLSAEEQAVVKQAAVDAMVYQRELAANEDEKLAKEMASNGITITRPTPEQLRMFKDAIAPIYDAYREKLGAELVDAAEAEVERLSK